MHFLFSAVYGMHLLFSVAYGTVYGVVLQQYINEDADQNLVTFIKENWLDYLFNDVKNFIHTHFLFSVVYGMHFQFLVVTVPYTV